MLAFGTHSSPVLAAETHQHQPQKLLTNLNPRLMTGLGHQPGRAVIIPDRAQRPCAAGASSTCSLQQRAQNNTDQHLLNWVQALAAALRGHLRLFLVQK